LNPNDMPIEPMAGDATILALTADLMFAARIRAAAPGAVTVHARSKLLGALGGATRLVLVDLQAREAVESIGEVRLAAPEARIVAFGPHVDEDALEAARGAGAHEVMTRGAFVRGLAGIVRDPRRQGS
jgi:hypothetical protein